MKCLILFAITMAVSVAVFAADGEAKPAAKVAAGPDVTVKDAYDLWKANPDQVNLLDVRTPEEYAFVGHPEGARNIPIMFMKYTFDAGSKKYAMELSPDFVANVEKHYKKTDALLVLCRSGARSTKAIALLLEAGFTNLREIPAGFEGNTLDDPASPDHGQRVVNGWKVDGLPWTYSLNPDLVYGFVRE